jgi:two-component system, OmpR family, response regulator
VRVLLIDDDVELCSLLAEFLAREGFSVECEHSGPGGLERARSGNYDLLILDVMLPGMDGFAILRELRKTSRVPVLMLTARGEDVDRIVGLEMGADDYLPKPFGSRELIARIKAVLRRGKDQASTMSGRRPKRYRFDRWQLDTGARELLRDDGVTVPLSTGEYDLLIALVERPQRVLSRDQLLDLARGRTAAALDRSIDTQVSRLRKKVERDSGDPKLIKTVWGGGYMFTPAVTPE